MNSDITVLLLTSRIVQDSKVKCDKIPIYEEDIVDVEVRKGEGPVKILGIYMYFSRFVRIPPGLCAEIRMCFFPS